MVSQIKFFKFVFWLIISLVCLNCLHAKVTASKEISPSTLDGDTLYSILSASLLTEPANKKELRQAFNKILQTAQKNKEADLYEQAAIIALKNPNFTNADVEVVFNQWRRTFPNDTKLYKYYLNFYVAKKANKQIQFALSKLFALADAKEKVEIIQSLPAHFRQSGLSERESLQQIQDLLQPYLNAASNSDYIVSALTVIAELQLNVNLPDDALSSITQALNSQAEDMTWVISLVINLADKLRDKILPTLKTALANKPLTALSSLNYAELLYSAKDTASATAVLERLINKLSKTKLKDLTQQELVALSQAYYLHASTLAEQDKFVIAKQLGNKAFQAVKRIDPLNSSDKSRRLRIILMMTKLELLTKDLTQLTNWYNKITSQERADFSDLINNNYTILIDIAIHHGLQKANQDKHKFDLSFLEQLPAVSTEERINKTLAICFTYSKLDKPQQAYKVINQALRREDKPNTELLFYKSLLANELGYKAEVETTLKSVLALDPKYSSALNNLGYFLLDYPERVDEAINYIQRALDISPNEATYLDSLAVAYLKKNRPEDAVNLLEQAYQTDDELEIMLHLIEALKQNKQAQRAQEIWTEAWQKYPESKKLKQLRPSPKSNQSRK